MTKNTIIQYSPEKPLCIWDGECGFCKIWIDKWKKQTTPRVKFMPYQEAIKFIQEIPENEFRKEMKLITPEGAVYGGAHAVFQILSYTQNKKWMLWIYENIPLADKFFDFIYSIIANNRAFFYRLMHPFSK